MLALTFQHVTFSLGLSTSFPALASIALLMGAFMHNLTLLPSWHLDVHSTCLLLHTMQRNPLPSSGLSPLLGFDISHKVLLHIDVDSLIRLCNTSTTADMWVLKLVNSRSFSFSSRLFSFPKDRTYFAFTLRIFSDFSQIYPAGRARFTLRTPWDSNPQRVSLRFYTLR